MDFLRLADDVARQKGIVIAIEPLRTQESNIINTGAEAQKLVHQVNRPNIQMIIDYYHLSVMRENPEIIWSARKDIVHFHFANPNGRIWPKSPSENPEYAQFFAMVKKLSSAEAYPSKAAAILTPIPPKAWHSSAVNSRRRYRLRALNLAESGKKFPRYCNVGATNHRLGLILIFKRRNVVNYDPAVGPAFERRPILTKQLASPPCSSPRFVFKSVNQY